MYGMQQLPQPGVGAGPAIAFPGPGAGAGISVELVNPQLWEQFHAARTEMIVTKTGRKLFPKLDISVCGLDPRRTYGIHLRLQRADEKKYRYSSSTWSASADDDDACFPRTPPVESNEGFAQLGEVWMAKSIEFTNFKITNNLEESRKGMILVQTLHKYVPVIYIYDLTTGITHSNLASGMVKEEVLHLAEFITVTAYQSEAIKSLKTEHNPFAKGCRGAAAKLQQQNEEVQQLQQQRNKRSYSPKSNPGLVGHRSADGAPSSKLASPAFPNMASMSSPSYALPTVPYQPPSNPFPSPPQETRASPATVPQQQQHHFQFPPPPPSFPGFDPSFAPIMMQPFPFASYFPLPGLAATPMEYGSMQQMVQHQQQQQYLPAPYTPQNQPEPDSNGNSPANSSYGQSPYTSMHFQAMGQMTFQTPDATAELPEVQDDDDAVSDSDEDDDQLANL
ncbi:hypothetical protein PRIPAC_94937 [Pristionchus pacificus]|uniref:Uncharacterized protein n=1 Tax=Pristionchus pacificus TaxID=54126 RepID=A0A454Y254_PRIPA|nr:hypothetical protein PRIPAC_94937 [Pristionchus pacificus]|eukprot:PDM62656.1 hypothetical protein PRIPAC_49871 [Pristionchus pacificus]